MKIPPHLAKSTNHLLSLIQPKNLVGVVYSMSYTSCTVMTNDWWKSVVRGIPHNSFLLATKMHPDKPEAAIIDQEVLLLRVEKPEALPSEEAITKMKIEYLQDKYEVDVLTQNKIQYGGIKCTILGTFYCKDGRICLGSDIESYSSAASLDVYRPKGTVLETIVNYISPNKQKSLEEMAADLNIVSDTPRFRIGSVRYTSTERLHRDTTEEEIVPVYINIVDFLAKRTGVFGMTRTGKSNAIKHIIGNVHLTSIKSDISIGQLIFDLNGEYANDNMQDTTNGKDPESLAGVLKGEVEVYRLAYPKPGMRVLQNNFYIHWSDGHNLLTSLLKENKTSAASDIEAFFELSFDKPDPSDYGATNRWNLKCTIYKCVLYKAGFPHGVQKTVWFDVDAKILKQVNDSLGVTFTPKTGISLEEATEWFEEARKIDRITRIKTSRGKNWLDEESKALTNLLTQKNDGGSYITGYKLLAPYIAYHNPSTKLVIEDEIYDELKSGKIVIIDLSVGDPRQKEKISERIARRIFFGNVRELCEGREPPNIMIYVEEAHNIIGQHDPLTATWPRLAKEGAKAKIGFVFATQEMSSIHKNILAATENWIVTHLNNTEEIRNLSCYYDFKTFGESLLRSQDVGFARIKTLSSLFVVPVQIDQFIPAELAKQVVKLCEELTVCPTP